MTDTRTRKERFLPWAWEKLGLHISIGTVTLDGKEAVQVDHERHLVEFDVPWEQCLVNVEVRATRDTLLEELLGPAGEAAVVVALRCDDTRWRFGVRVPVAKSRECTPAQVKLERSMVAGIVELQAYLVADGGSLKQELQKGFRVAAGRPWELRVDRTRELSGVYLDVRYRSFKNDPAIPEVFRANVWQLDLETDAPILWLNSDHQELVSVLDARGHVGARAVARDVAFDTFVPQVWTQLFVRAAITWAKLGEAGAGWQDAVLDAVARMVFPASDTAAARSRIEAELADGELPEVVSRLQATLQVEQDAARHLLRLVTEVSS